MNRNILKTGLAAAVLFCVGPVMAPDYKFDDINDTDTTRLTRRI